MSCSKKGSPRHSIFSASAFTKSWVCIFLVTVSLQRHSLHNFLSSRGQSISVQNPRNGLPCSGQCTSTVYTVWIFSFAILLLWIDLLSFSLEAKITDFTTEVPGLKLGIDPVAAGVKLTEGITFGLLACIIGLKLELPYLPYFIIILFMI